MKNGVMMQYFEWYLNNDPHLWTIVEKDAMHLSKIGIDAVWLPPAFKCLDGQNDVGYGVYDLYDLGEFDQKGTIATKYGTKDEYLKAIQALKNQHIQVYGDIVLDHKMGADEYETVEAFKVNRYNTQEIMSCEETIEVPTLFTFENRHQKYSHFIWDHTCFDGVDYDRRHQQHAMFLFKDKQWNDQVDDENGNFDYLMGADIDFSVEKVINELNQWGKWYLDITHLDGFRLDAVKHIQASFYKDWVKQMRDYTQKDLFVVGEYWHGDVKHLIHYLKEVQYEMSLFDVPLHYHFYDASQQGENYDLTQIFNGTLVQSCPSQAVTFVDNHDTQPHQALQSWIDDWFKPLAYCLILLRQEGYPCIFYGDYYGISQDGYLGYHDLLDQLLYLRKHYALGNQIDYFHDPHMIGWVREKGLVCLMSNKNDGYLKMHVGRQFAYRYFDDVFHHQNKVYIDENGDGDFFVSSQSVSVYIVKGDCHEK